MLLDLEIISEMFCCITEMLYLYSVKIINMVQIYKKYRT